MVLCQKHEEGMCPEYRQKTYSPETEGSTIGVVSCVAGPSSPNVSVPAPLGLMQKLKESGSWPVLANLLGTDIGVVPSPISPSGAAPFSSEPVCIWPHLR